MVRDYLKQHIAKDLADFDLKQRKRETFYNTGLGVPWSECS
jgi:hypothetical protein